MAMEVISTNPRGPTLRRLDHLPLPLGLATGVMATVSAATPIVRLTTRPGPAQRLRIHRLHRFGGLPHGRTGALRRLRLPGHLDQTRAALTTPALEKIGVEPVDLLVSFYGANYATATMTPIPNRW